MNAADRRRLEADLDVLVANLLDPRAAHLARAQAADELRRRVRWLVGNRAEVLVPTPTPAALPIGPDDPTPFHTVAIGPDEIAELRAAMSAIVADTAKLRRIAAAGTPQQAAATLEIPSVADRLPDIWLEIL